MCCEESGKKLKSLWITHHMLNPHRALSLLSKESPQTHPVAVALTLPTILTSLYLISKPRDWLLQEGLLAMLRRVRA